MNKARVAEAARGIIQFEKRPPIFSKIVEIKYLRMSSDIRRCESVLHASIERAIVCLNLKQNDKYGKTYTKKL